METATGVATSGTDSDRVKQQQGKTVTGRGNNRDRQHKGKAMTDGDSDKARPQQGEPVTGRGNDGERQRQVEATTGRKAIRTGGGSGGGS